jgi:hypothetical protein
MLRQARIEADVEVVVDPGAEVLATCCADAALVVLPMQLRGKQPLDPFGNRLDGLLARLPMTLLVRAAEDIDLCAEPDEGEHSEVSAALDEASDAVERARQAEKVAREAQVAAERKRQEVQKVPLLADEDVDKLQREVDEASRTAEDLERAARKARHQARNAAATARERSSRSSQVIQEKARSLQEEAGSDAAGEDSASPPTTANSMAASRD